MIAIRMLIIYRCVIAMVENAIATIVLLYLVVALVKLFMFHSCTIDVFLRYVQIKKFIIIIITTSLQRLLESNILHTCYIRLDVRLPPSNCWQRFEKND